MTDFVLITAFSGTFSIFDWISKADVSENEKSGERPKRVGVVASRVRGPTLSTKSSIRHSFFPDMISNR